MAAADAPVGLMDIATTLAPAEIPFKLRCAICSNLALNAFRLPCCDQSVCESCKCSFPRRAPEATSVLGQGSLHDTCPVCAHTPVSADLCKPNKALRTTLKAFLRTEEKKRERDRQATVPPTPDTPPDSVAAPQQTPTESKATEPAPISTTPDATQPGKASSEETSADAGPAGTTTEIEAKTEPKPVDQPELAADQPVTSVQNADAGNTAESNNFPAEADVPIYHDDSAMAGPQGFSQQQNLQFLPQNMGSGGFPGMGWNGSANFGAMNPYMANGMFNFPNAMGMPMAMDPMAANQGMFGDYGMNMSGMMNMGVNYNGQGMYGSLGWDGSQQNNMWHGGQDKFNPNAFANGTGPPYGAAFGGSNMSPYPSNPDFQAGYHGHGRGGFRGRGRGHFANAGRGGFGGSGPYMQGAHSPALPSQSPPNGTAPGGNDGTHTGPVSNENAAAEDCQEGAAAAEGPPGDQTDQQLRGIPTIDSFDQPVSMKPGAYATPMGSGYGRGGYMRGPGRGGFHGGPMSGPYQPTNTPVEPRGVGVEGAPAAPRAMRQGLPNTSVFRQRGFQVQGLASSHSRGQSQGANSETPRDNVQSPPPANAPSKPAGSRSQSPSQTQVPRSPSPSVHDRDDGRDSGRERNPERSGRTGQDRPSRSRSPKTSRRSSRRRHHENDGDGKSNRRPHHSRRHRSRTGSRSRSPSRNGDCHHADRLARIAEEPKPNGRSKAPASEKGGRDLASRISTGMRSRHREEERESGRDRERRRRDRKRDRDRDTEGEPRRDREREKDRVRESDRERPRERDRKRSRRDRSESANASAHPSREHARRTKRSRANDGQAQDSLNDPAEPQKDPPHWSARRAIASVFCVNSSGVKWPNRVVETAGRTAC
ncbi:hypothetical protein N7510_006553 [Penicillium lagena]|uniref:uncharacterized protein n=1 Tax=Penicillium lagena TaxID=94218 RepID=UPI00253FAE4A|nr:uncharacterized protein N7510_006553 [Penicillium lagena]KAJ5613359.1 hypothetical protein N7510_006553 [Penicillium lagena]